MRWRADELRPDDSRHTSDSFTPHLHLFLFFQKPAQRQPRAATGRRCRYTKKGSLLEFPQVEPNESKSGRVASAAPPATLCRRHATSRHKEKQPLRASRCLSKSSRDKYVSTLSSSPARDTSLLSKNAISPSPLGLSPTRSPAAKQTNDDTSHRQ